MLRQVVPDLFEGRTGEDVQIVAVATDNGGVEDATYRYPGPLDTEIILGRPGCRIVVKSGREIFGCKVGFDDDAPSPRYDLHQVVNGSLSPLGVTLTPAAGDTVLLRFDGVAAVVLASAPPKPSAEGAGTAAATRKAAAKRRTAAAKRKAAAKRRAAAKRKAVAKRKPTSSRKTASSRGGSARTTGARKRR